MSSRRLGVMATMTKGILALSTVDKRVLIIVSYLREYSVARYEI
jgi:hypothetical protein